MSERNIRLLIEYKGTHFSGWQIQREQQTIQGEITEAVFKTTGCRINLIGAGRTDAGVHALGQVANFRISHHLEVSRYKDALNYYLDDDIRIKSAEEVPLSFHARFDAKRKRYRYLLAQERSALYREYRWELQYDIDPGLMQRAAALIVGEHDFSAFCVTASLQESNMCQIESARWRKVGPLFLFDIRGNRFLHNMVRSLVGAMVNLATVQQDSNKLNLTLADFEDIIQAPNDRRTVFTAPAQGLYLVSVAY